MGFFALFFTIHLFFLAGYAVRWLFIAYENLPKEKPGFFPTALEAILGYALSALLCLSSLLIFKSMWYGGLLACCFSYWSFFRLSKRQQIGKIVLGWDSVFLLKLTFIALIIVIYLPAIAGKSSVYRLPAIFDLPKQIAALISAAHAKAWPAPNPYYPELSFAYNLLFYLPLGLIAKSFHSAKLFLPIFVVSLVWVSWQALACLEMVMERVGLSHRAQFFGILLTTFISGFMPYISASDAPIGHQLRASGLSDLWVDDSIISFIYIPQHLFALLCIFIAWMLFNRSNTWLTNILLALILSTAALSSFLFAPTSYLIFSLFMVVEFYSKKKRLTKKNLTTVVLFFSTNAYFVWQAREWAGAKTSFLGWPLHYGWHYLLASQALLLFACCFSFYFIREKLWNRLGLSYGILLCSTLIILVFSQDTDLGIKQLLFIKMLLIIPAAAGLTFCWNKLKQTLWLRWFLLVLPLSYFCSLSAILFGFFITKSYIQRSYQEQQLLHKLQKLPFDSVFLFLDPDVEKSTVGGHLSFLDFRSYREDAYLPIRERNFSFDISALINKNFQTTHKSIKAIIANNEFLSLSTPQIEEITLKDLKNWALWPQDKSSKFRSNSQELQSEHITDLSLYTSLFLTPGIYFISLKIIGNILEGEGHISVSSSQKFITIPAGNYQDPKEFSTLFVVGDAAEMSTISFGLGGLEKGSGKIALHSLTIKKMPFQDRR